MTADPLLEAVAVVVATTITNIITIVKLAAVTSPRQTSPYIEARAAGTTITATINTIASITTTTTTMRPRHRAITEGVPAAVQLIRPTTMKVTVGVEVEVVMSSTITWRTAPTSPRATT